MLTPSLKAFLQAKQPIPIFKKRSLEDLEAFKIYHNLGNRPPSCLLESVKGPDRINRYSFIATEPFLVFEAKGHHIRLAEGHRCTTIVGNPIKLLSELITRFHVSRPAELPPFFGGAIGFFGYDLVHMFENLPRNALDDLHLPDISLAFFETVLAIDHVEKNLYLIFCPTPEKFWQSDRTRLYHHAQETLRELESNLVKPAPSYRTAFSPDEQTIALPPQANLTQEEYIQRVKRCQAYIAQGDIFQANLSLRFSASLKGCPPLTLYSILREVNPAPFAAFLNLGRLQLISSSPERLVHVSGRSVETRPIAGTRPRGKNTAEDRQMTLNLLTHAKERAEHLMLLDLERNDLGRVCQYGSIKVDEFMVTEQYSHVIHIVSNIQGRLRERATCLDVLQAVFPGGTITGVPKVRCMEIIDELEPVARGPYTGSIGYISFAGDMDLNIIIRSLLSVQDTAYFQVGAGIVADSDPLGEYQECLYKAEALMKSIRMVRQQRQRNG
jgi:aminodeoxychorismate synthase component I